MVFRGAVLTNTKMKLLTTLLFMISIGTSAQTQKGYVTDEIGTEVAFGQVEFIFERSSSIFEVDVYGYFEFHLSDTINAIVYHSPDGFRDTSRVDCFIDNNFEIKTQYPLKGIVCGPSFEWNAEGTNLDYRIFDNGKETVNHVDSLNQKQGRWILIHKNNCGKELDKPWEIGYFKNDVKIGKWLKIDPHDLSVLETREY